MKRHLKLSVALSLLLVGGVAIAQPFDAAEPNPFGPIPDQPAPVEPPAEAITPDFGPPDSTEIVPSRDIYPRLRLIYYAGFEGNSWKEIAYLELDEWTAEKDIIITSKWVQPSGLRSPGVSNTEQLRRRDPFKARYSRMPTRRTWVVEYADAATEGESHIFVNAPGLPRFSERILHERDFISFLHIPTSGWHQMGAAARAARYLELDVPPTQDPTIIPSPSDTRSR